MRTPPRQGDAAVPRGDDGEPPGATAAGIDAAGRRLRDVLTRMRIGRLESVALGCWLATRLGVLVFSWFVAWGSQSTGVGRPRPWTSLWQRWDWLRYQGIAEHGYTSAHGVVTDPTTVAFFPGYPLLLRAVYDVLGSWVWAGLLISLVAGGFAVVGLARITAAEWTARAAGGESSPEPAARNAVLFLTCGPAAIFLAAGYTEPLFLALALNGWFAARRRRWVTAGVLIGFASLVRVNGLFVLAAVAVLFLTGRPRRADWRAAPALLLPVASVVGYMAYLHAVTGDWFAWKHAESIGWYRNFTSPVTAFRHTWYYAFDHGFQASEAWEFQLELLCALVGVVLVCWLLVRRRWPELTYVGISLVALVTSYWFMSIPREMLLWWPLWTGLGVWAARRRWVATTYLVVAVPMMVGIGYLFLTGNWAG